MTTLFSTTPKKETKMAKVVYNTEEERRAARCATYAKYNQAHKAERAAHNKAYVQRLDVKTKRREAYRRKAAAPSQGVNRNSNEDTTQSTLPLRQSATL